MQHKKIDVLRFENKSHIVRFHVDDMGPGKGRLILTVGSYIFLRYFDACNPNIWEFLAKQTVEAVAGGFDNSEAKMKGAKKTWGEFIQHSISPFWKEFQYHAKLLALAPEVRAVLLSVSALKDQHKLYPAKYNGKVPLKVKMNFDVKSDLPGLMGRAVITAYGGQEYFVWVNQLGAVSALLPGLEQLGLKPNEFEVVEYHYKPDPE